MAQNYLQVQRDYLLQAWRRPIEELQNVFRAEQKDGELHFRAFGEPCILTRDAVHLAGKRATGPRGLLIALYASHAHTNSVQMHPLKSYKEFPGSMPYQGAFRAHAEMALAPHVSSIHGHQQAIVEALDGHINEDAPSGDFSFTLMPLPLTPLYYIFHLADDEFPASVSCLFASNANQFMPLDGLADVAEYTAKAIVKQLNG